jgi:hypothetical protein
VAGGTVRVTADEPTLNATFTADCEGYVYAVAPAANVMLEFYSEEVDGTRFCPRDFFVPYTVPKADVRALDLDYWPAIQIVAAPAVTTSGPPEAAPSPLYGTKVTVEYRVSAQAISTSRTKALTKPASPKSPAEITGRLRRRAHE